MPHVVALLRVNLMCRPSSRGALPGIRIGRYDPGQLFLKLDAGTEASLVGFNRPTPALRVTDIVDGLASLPEVTTQTKLAGGSLGNASPNDIETLITCLAQIRPHTVQLYTLDRVSPKSSLLRLDPGHLDSIARHLHHLGIPTMAFRELQHGGPFYLCASVRIRSDVSVIERVDRPNGRTE